MSKTPIRRIVASREYDSYNYGQPDYISCRLLKFGGEKFKITLKTDSELLVRIWESNFPASQETTNPNGTVEIYNGNGTSVRLYDKENHRIIITNNDYYGCVKYGYRVICADLMAKKKLKNLVSMHSSAIVVKGQTIIITGTSGAGKNTLYNYLDSRYDCMFLWDDWGTITTTGEIFKTNELLYHMSKASASTLTPDFDEWDQLICEKRNAGKIPKYMMPIHELRETGNNTLKDGKTLKVHSIVILTNEPRYTDARKVDVDEAVKVFSEPSYSYAWECLVPFKDEHLLMNNDELHLLGKKYRDLFENVDNLVVANNTKQEVDKLTFLQNVEKSVGIIS